MTEEPQLISRLRAALADVPELSEKKMFGSVGFLVRGNLCLSARTERIMCRIDPALHEEVTALPGCETVVMKGRPYRGYVYVSATVLRTERDLQHWIELALKYNRTLASAARDV